MKNGSVKSEREGGMKKDASKKWMGKLQIEAKYTFKFFSFPFTYNRKVN